jgi:hypothetical protein
VLALVIVSVYVGLGVVAVMVFLLMQRPASALRGPGGVVAMFLFWPLLAPALLFAEAGVVGDGGGSEHARRIEELDRRLRVALDLHDGGNLPTRERGTVAAFIANLRLAEQRRGELAAAEASAPAVIRGKLARLRQATTQRLDDGLSVAEELLGQLMLLRFADTSPDGASRDPMEDLLARIEALASLTPELEGADARPTEQELPPGGVGERDAS